MPASIRIIKIVKDKNPVSGEEDEAYTAEIEIIADSAKDLAKELTACPYGEEIMDLLERAEFIPKKNSLTIEEMKEQAKTEEEERLKHEEELREEGRHEIREKYLVYIRKKRPDSSIEQIKDDAEKGEPESLLSNDEEPKPITHDPRRFRNPL